LLNSGSVFTGLSAPAICKVDKVDAVGVDDGECLGATLGRRAYIGRVVAKLEDMTGFLERGFLKVQTIPLLCFPTRQEHVKQHCDNHRLTSTVWKGLKEWTRLMQPGQRNSTARQSRQRHAPS